MIRARTISGVRCLVSGPLVLVLIGCHGSSSSPSAPLPTIDVVPLRNPTAGDPLLARLPAGADVLVELDLKRLRDNAVIGDLAARALDDPALVAASAQLGTPVAAAPLARADALVLASYRVGTATAVTFGLYVGGGLAPGDVDGGVALGDGVVGMAPDGSAPELLGVIPGHALSDDAGFLALRATAMPAKAEGASLRITARLGFDARIALASQLGLDAAPASVSAWGDVADDLAVVAVIDAGDVGGGAVSDEVGKAMASSIRDLLDDVAVEPAIRAVGLTPAVRAFQVEPRAAVVHVVALVGPSRLERAAGRARTLLSLTGGS